MRVLQEPPPSRKVEVLTEVGEYSRPRILLCGDTAVSVEIGNDIHPAINQRVHRLFRMLRARQHPGILDLNPTYRSLLIQYDPWICSYENLLILVEDCLDIARGSDQEEAQVIDIPVCYGGEFGPDLEEVAAYHGVTPSRVVDLHIAPVYHVYMIGFTPGFSYLGGLDERLYTPRKKDPRKKVPAGSVGIADRQTGIYPIESPGGWQLIGRTPLKLFDIHAANPFLLSAGDALRFKPITREEFESAQNP